MKHLYTAFIACLCCLTLSFSLGQDKKIHVALFDDEGSGNTGIENVEKALLAELNIEVQRISAEDIRSGILHSFDIVVFSGGRGSKQAAAIESRGLDSVRQFVKQGGGYLGICAGAYLSTVEYPW